MENIEKINSLLKRLYNEAYIHYDELIEELEEPAVSLILDGFDEMPRYTPILPENAFVDELWGDYEDIKSGNGLCLCFSVPYDDCEGCERVDEMPVEELDEDYLEKLVDFVEKKNN